jgi:hypothetical protein
VSGWTVAGYVAGGYSALLTVVVVGCWALRRADKGSKCENAPSLVDSLVDLEPAPAPADAGHAVDADWLADQPAEVTRPKMSKAELDRRIAEIEAELAELR